MRHYLDHASTSPLRPAARDAMVAALGLVGDPGRVHAEGLAVRAMVEQWREEVAATLGARPREVVFCSGASEAIAAAVHGAAARGAHSVLAGVEHSAVRAGAERGPHTLVAVEPTGRIDVDAVGEAVRGDTGVVHCQFGNHEVGTLQPLGGVVEAVDGRALVHVDAAAAVGHVRCSFGGSGADLWSVSSHKLGGPTGVGALVIRRGLRLDPLVVGGDQERARRAGMENVAAIAGFAAALTDAVASIEEAAARARARTTRILEWARHAEGVSVLGDPDDRLPHIACLALADVEPQPVLQGLDRAGVAVHSGSSCSSEAIEPSPVLEAMGADAQRSLRVSVGWSTTDADVDAFLDAAPKVLGDLRALRTVTPRDGTGNPEQ